MSKRSIALAVLLAACLLPSALLLLDSFAEPTEEEIAGSAPEDILGLGFFFSWAVVGFAELCLLAGATFAADTSKQRVAVIAALVIFLLVSVFAFSKYQQLERRVLGPSRAGERSK